jgi:mutator protein MutT
MESTNSNLVIEVAAGLVFRDGKLLISQRKENTHLAGLWEFPGGKRELNETFEQCLIRELREELGIEVTVGELIESLTHSYSEKTVHLKFFRCDWARCEPQALNCSAFRWVSRSELPTYSFPAADSRLLAKLSCESQLWVHPARLASPSDWIV